MIPAITRNKTDVVVPVNTYLMPFLLSVVYGLFSQYFYLSLIGGAALAIIIQLFWKPFLPTALLYCFGFMWLQVFAIILYSDYVGQPIEELILTRNAEFLIEVTFAQLVLMAVTASIFVKRSLSINFYKILRAASQLNTKRIIIAYVVSTLTLPALLKLSGNGTLNQVVQTIALLRPTFIMLLAFMLFIKRDRFKGIIIAILILEFLLGFVSYFSSFKDVVLYIILVYLVVNPIPKASLLIKVLPAAFALSAVLVFWSYVKPEYRQYLNGGSNQQQVTVGTEDALNFLWKKVQQFDKQSFNSGTEILLFRVQAMAYYLELYNRVPRDIPFENGANTLSTIKFLTLPRFLNQDKEILDPSAKLSYYSGKKFMGAKEGTSIAMGYFCDFYVDFDVWVMFIPIIILGGLIGAVSNYVIRTKGINLLLMISLLTAYILNMGFLDSDVTFVLGGLRNFFVVFILMKWFVFPWLNKYLTK